MAQKGLGNIFNVVSVASGKHVSLKNGQAVTFICYEDGGAQAIAIKESIAGASEATLSTVTELYASDGIGGVWTRETTDANGALGDGDGAIVKKDTTAFDCAVFCITADELSKGFDSVEVTVDGGTCTAIVHDLNVKRTPANLAAAAV